MGTNCPASFGCTTTMEKPPASAGLATDIGYLPPCSSAKEAVISPSYSVSNNSQVKVKLLALPVVSEEGYRVKVVVRAGGRIKGCSDTHQLLTSRLVWQ